MDININIQDLEISDQYNLLKIQNKIDELKSIEYKESNEYKQNIELVNKDLSDYEIKRKKYCTGHILEPNMVFNPIIRLTTCEKCVDDTKNNRMHFELKVPKYERLEYVRKELQKLETVRREITYAYTCILNNHTGDILDLFNALFNMQINILDNDTGRFKKEFDILIDEYNKTHNSFGLFIYKPPPPTIPYNHTENDC